MNIITFKNHIVRAIGEAQSKDKAKHAGIVVVYEGEEIPEGVNIIQVPFPRGLAQAMADNHREKTHKQIEDAKSTAPRVKIKTQPESKAMKEARLKYEQL